MLQQAGWDEVWEEKSADFAGKGLRPARVLAQYRNSYSLWTAAGEADAEIAGALLYRAEAGGLPVVGDWVAIRQYAPTDLAIIADVLPRKTKFSRKASGSVAEEQVIAANIDLLFIVCGLDHDYNLRRLERYLVAAGQSGAQPIIVLNKADLCTDLTTRIAEVEAIATDVPVLAISAVRQFGSVHQNSAETLLPMITAGKTAALVGSSGAGKSTIVNQLLGTAAQATQPTRESDSRGRHTTTHRELFFLSNGGLILDNPGIRELQLWAQDFRQGSPQSAVDEAFPEIRTPGGDLYFSRLYAHCGTCLRRPGSSGVRRNRRSTLAQLSEVAARIAPRRGAGGSKSASNGKRAMEEAVQRREAQSEAEISLHFT